MSQEGHARIPVSRTFTASQDACPHDASTLWVVQHRHRIIHTLDESVEATFRDTRCPREECPLRNIRYRPVEETMLALPGMHFGLDVVAAVGSMRMREDASFPVIHERLMGRGVPIAAMTVQYLFRNYLALVSCAAGAKDPKLLQMLRHQGGIIPVIDGVQFGEGEPVLYLIIDALSRRPLFGKEFTARGADDLVPFIAQLNDLGVPLIAVVSDKERALVPAIAEALPGVKHQFCQVHYVGNVAKPMAKDLKALGAEIRQTEEALRGYQRKLLRHKREAEKKGEAPPTDLGVSIEFCEAARAEARRTARAPFDPPALKRHEGLDAVRDAVHEARQKKGAPGRTSGNSSKSSPPRPRGARSPRASRHA